MLTRFRLCSLPAWLAVAAMLAACSSKPSESLIREQVLASIVDDGTKDLIEIEGFAKTNGFEPSPNAYVADIKYKVVFRKSLKQLSAELQHEVQANKSGPGADAVDKAMDGAAGALVGIGTLGLMFKYGDFQAGDSIERTDRVTFNKTENGWQLATQPQPAL